MSYNLQLEDMMDKSVQHSIDLIVTSPIQVELLHTTYYVTPLLTTIYIKICFKLHPYINSDCHQYS